MRIPATQKGLSSANVLLGALLALAVVLHIAIASVRYPVGPRYGDHVHGNTTHTTHVAGELRVATYNIRRGKGLDGERDLARTAANLEPGYDIVGLNEVGGAFLPLRDDAALLGKALDTGWLFAPSQGRWYIDYFGNGLLTRLAPDDWQSLPMFHDLAKGTGHRQVLTVNYRWDSQPFAVLVVHAERGDVRDRQIRHAFAEFARHPRAILLGDLNATAAEPVMAEVLAMSDATSMFEADSALPRELVDWVVVRGFRLLEAGFVPPGASDHPVVWASLALAD